jgi:hypothetical protein
MLDARVKTLKKRIHQGGLANPWFSADENDLSLTAQRFV